MIVARSPLRISFSGGGTDLPAFYRKYGPGFVVSTSIDKHVYVTMNKKFGGEVSVRYRIHENCSRTEDLKHALIREILLAYDVHDSIEIVVISDVPASGSGLGASSALACALVAALEKYKYGTVPDKHSVAAIAARIETDRVGSPIGKQDHYASAIGGLNGIWFYSDEGVSSKRFGSDDFISEIEGQSMLFYLDIEREYVPGGRFVQKILRDQVAEVDSKRKFYELQRDNALGMWEHMTYEVPERFMDHVNENWRIKRGLHPEISNARIDSIIQSAYGAGATAAKVCGAGGGGFVYFMVPPSMQGSVRERLSGLKELKFSFDRNGVEILYDGNRSAVLANR